MRKIQTSVYIQQELAVWYYCESAQAYDPHVQQCPDGWLTVPTPATKSR